MAPSLRALLLLASGALVAASAHEDAGAALAQEDDECRSVGGEEDCALSALQRRVSFLSRSWNETNEEPADGEEIQALAHLKPDFELRDDPTAGPDDGEEDMVDDEPYDDDSVAPHHAVDEPVDSAAEGGMPPRLPGMPLPGQSGRYPLPGGAGGVPGGFPLPREGLPPIENCWGPNATARCPAGYSCVVKYDGTYSQCMDCSAWSFAKSCQKLDDYMRYSAVQTCKRSCLNTKCYNSAWCKKPHKCIVDRKSNWGQCIACHSKKFWKASCYATPKGLLRHAQHVCHKHCKGYQR